MELIHSKQGLLLNHGKPRGLVKTFYFESEVMKRAKLLSTDLAPEMPSLRSAPASPCSAPSNSMSNSSAAHAAALPINRLSKVTDTNKLC